MTPLTDADLARMEGTPRPVLGDHGWGSLGSAVIDRFGNYVCLVHGDYANTPIGERALLIAAAPAMRDDLDELLAEVRRLRAVIGEERHIADIRAESYGLEHPTACRPSLIDCPVNVAVGSLDLDEVPVPGRYVVTLDDEGLHFEALGGEG